MAERDQQPQCDALGGGAEAQQKMDNLARPLLGTRGQAPREVQDADGKTAS